MKFISKFTIFALLWLLLTLLMGSWWMFHGLSQAKLVLDLQKELSVSNEALGMIQFEKEYRMIRYEGIFFHILILIGGTSLVFYSIKSSIQKKRLQDFFATLTHEMKTPLATLRLKIETLMEEPLDVNARESLRKLSEEEIRLENQMDKAFYISALLQGENLLLEVLKLSEIQNTISQKYKNVDWNLEAKELYFDRRAIEVILSNLIENSLKHGKSSLVKIRSLVSGTKTILEISDAGSGFVGKEKYLGKAFHRHTNTSGSGVGLFLTKKLLQKVKGKISFPKVGSGFLVRLEFPNPC